MRGLVPLVLMALGSCAPSPSDRLIGTWRPDHDSEDVLRANLAAHRARAGGGSSRSDLDDTRAPLGIVWDEEFRSDGTSGTATIPGEARPLPGTWRVLEEGPSSVVIRQQYTTGAPAIERRLVFESQDTVRVVGGLRDGIRMRRVK